VGSLQFLQLVILGFDYSSSFESCKDREILKFVPPNDKKSNIFAGTVRPEGFLIRVSWGELGY
jgi:hypothetical protein